jgi:hypothetical protein
MYAIMPFSRTKLLLHLYSPSNSLETSLTLPSHSTLPNTFSFEFYFKVMPSLSLSPAMPHHTYLLKHTHITPMHTLFQACYLIFVLCISQSLNTTTTFTLSHMSTLLLPTLPTTRTQFKICKHFKTHSLAHYICSLTPSSVYTHTSCNARILLNCLHPSSPALALPLPFIIIIVHPAYHITLSILFYMHLDMTAPPEKPSKPASLILSNTHTHHPV